MNIFSCAYWQSVSSLEKFLFKPSAHSFELFLLLLLLSCMSCLFIQKLSSKSHFNTSYRSSLVVMNPFNFCWSGKLLISPSILKNNLSKRLFYTSVFLLLSCIQGCWERERGMIWENGIQFSLLSNFHISIKFSSVQSLSRVRLFVTP